MIYYSLMKTPNSYIKTIRYAVQGVFLLLTLFIGYRFYEFVMQFTTPGHPLVQRPPAVEAFLPIAGLLVLLGIAASALQLGWISIPGSERG